LAKLNKIPLFIALGALPLGLAGEGCVSDIPGPSGVCSVDPTLDCSVKVSPTSPGQDVGLVPYTCTGALRPDENSRYYEDVPRGSVCADKGVTADGKQAYCCSAATTSCAFDPYNSCDPGTSGYQCRGASRPDVFNAAISCGQGLRDGQYINYCCTGQTPPPNCTENSSFTPACDPRLLGFSCAIGVLPRGSDLVKSESHADNFRFLCPVAEPARNDKLVNYCCYMAAPPPDGYSCVEDTTVPGCNPRQFGFACTGVDTPDQDYPPMNCPKPGFSGRSAEGYPSTLYCCDFKPPPATP
jgi:hypothetical protein